MAGSGDAGAIGRDKVVGFIGGLQADRVVEDVGKLLELAGDLAQTLLPRGFILHQRGAGREFGVYRNQRLDGRFLGEVRRGILFLGADLLLGLDLQITVKRTSIATIGGEPEAARDSFGIVVERKLHGGQGAVAMRAMGVVLVRCTQPNLHVRAAATALRIAGERAELRRHLHVFDIRNGIADEIRPGLRLCLGVRLRFRVGLRRRWGRGAKRVHRPVQFRLHHLQQDRVYLGRFHRGTLWLAGLTARSGVRWACRQSNSTTNHKTQHPLLVQRIVPPLRMHIRNVFLAAIPRVYPERRLKD